MRLVAAVGLAMLLLGSGHGFRGGPGTDSTRAPTGDILFNCP
jgi:hypothetical protein